jgi:Flp pilus assembly protein TadG
MPASQTKIRNLMELRRERSRGIHQCSGQATIEFVFIFFILAALVFGLIDFCRVISTRQVMINLTREGSNLASRNTALTNTVAAILASASPLNIGTKGRIIVTAVTNSNNLYTITDQISEGGITAVSVIGTGVNTPATMPATTVPIPPLGQTVYVTELFYSFEPITPIGKLLELALPTQLYEVAYF